jgi:hypothetical protein
MQNRIKIAVAVTWIASCAFAYYAGTVPSAPLAREVVEEDVDDDGIWDFRNHLELGQLKRQEADLDKDGRADVICHYSGGTAIRVEEDDDGDGIMDMWTTFSSGVPIQQTRDLNRDGLVDLVTEYDRGRPAYEYLYSTNKAIYCLSFMRQGLERIEYHDRNRDGLFETIRRYDVFGMPGMDERLEPPLKLDDLGDLKARARAASLHSK